jgi:hypothetical protein
MSIFEAWVKVGAAFLGGLYLGLVFGAFLAEKNCQKKIQEQLKERARQS